LAEHNRGKTTFTRTGFPWDVVFTEKFEKRSEAFKRERYIKGQKSSKYIRGLIEKFSSVVPGHSIYNREGRDPSENPSTPTLKIKVLQIKFVAIFYLVCNIVYTF